MRLFICALFLGAVACYSPSSKTSYVSQQSIGDVKNEEIVEEPILLRVRNNSVASSTEALGPAISSLTPLSTTAAESSSLSSVKPEIEEMKPIKEEPTLSTPAAAPATPVEESFAEPAEQVPSKRRIVTYDQRQEGQYNIRADLENFMIVLIPPSPADGLNLLDILTKSSIRPSKNKRKQYTSSGGHRGNEFKYRQSLKSGNTNFNLNYLPRSHGQAAHQPPVTLVDNVSGQRLPSEFIEGRTPYHVDISASDDEQSRVHADGPVDVLPPPYPLAYQHLIKPFHLDAEPTVIGALPPADINQSPSHASGNFLETYNQLLASSLNANAAIHAEADNKPGYYRMSRTISNDNYLDSNRLAYNSLGATGRRVQIPLYRADMAYGASSVYPPLDVPRLMGYLTADSSSNSFETRQKSLSDDYGAEKSPQQLEESNSDELVIMPASANYKDDLELGLHSDVAGLIDADTLLGDVKSGMERCAPGRRRDSYGVCRDIEGY